MKFRIELDIPKLPTPITHTDYLLLLGSCFSESMCEKLLNNKFNVLANPHGILFNPVSVVDAIVDCINAPLYTTDNLFPFNEAWHSWKHHSRFSGLTPEDALHKINTSIQHAHQFLKQADYIFITLGSAWTYTFTHKAIHVEVGRVAGNNHKAPADWFVRKLMNLTETISLLDDMMQALFIFNPDIKIIYTISPVRHIREGLIDNNRSKAVLIQSVHELVEKHAEKAYYFPAYELMVDDLRDYRFYAEDMVHPNYYGTQYVWEKFVDACMYDSNTKMLIKEIQEINLAFNHKPFNPTSESHRKFLASYHQKTSVLQEKYSYLDFSKEIEKFSKV